MYLGLKTELFGLIIDSAKRENDLIIDIVQSTNFINLLTKEIVDL